MPECQKIRKGGLEQYGTECFGRLIFATIRKNMGVKGLMQLVMEEVWSTIHNTE